MRNLGPRTIRAALVAAGLGATAALVGAAVPGPAVALAAAAAPATLTVTGHGWGWGTGMGQWGAEGYAQQGWSYQQILAHYYGGTTLAPDANAAPSGIEVALSELAGDSSVKVATTAPTHLVIDGAATSATSATIRSGQRASATGGGWVTVTGTSGGAPWSRVYGGTISLAGGQVYDTVNLTQYVEGVVPFESEASWGEAALQSQAVAARSYALADTANGTKPICDWAACQVYGGDPAQVAGPYTAASNAAVTSTMTSGQPLVLYCSASACGATNSVALAQYSASTGGYTAGGMFPAVVDDGDSVAPEHTWTTTISLAQVQAAFPSVGTAGSVSVIQRNGLGDMGGRVLQVAVAGSRGSESVSGEYFAAALGLDSDWFSLSSSGTNTPAVSSPAPPSPGQAVAMVRTANGKGYWVASSGGDVYAYGDAHFYGDRPGANVVAFQSTPDDRGYWLLTDDGAVYPFGDARNLGSEAGHPIAGAMVAMVVSPGGGGYWLVSSSGGVYAFGNARNAGNLVGHPISGTITAAARTSNGRGYWLISSTGAVYGLGNARSFGSLTAVRKDGPVVAFSSIPTNNGHWLLVSGGGVYDFGPAKWYRSLTGKTKSAVAVVGSVDGKGYWILTANGAVTGFGDAHNYGHPSL